MQERLLKKAADAAMDGDDADDPSKLSQEAIDRIARRAAGMVEDEKTFTWKGEVGGRCFT